MCSYNNLKMIKALNLEGNELKEKLHEYVLYNFDASSEEELESKLEVNKSILKKKFVKELEEGGGDA